MIILDEIQTCERVLKSLKYFCEDAPEYYVAAAGSLPGVAINRKQYSLYPLDFEEYLWARGFDQLTQDIRLSYSSMESLNDALHFMSIELYQEYLIVGGMPASINAFLKNLSFIDVNLVQNEIINNYIADMAK